MSQQNGTILRVIGGLKLAKAAMLIAAGVGALSLGGHGVQTLAWHFHHDEGNHLVDQALGKLAQVPPHRLHELGIGCFVYAALFATEGVGLWLRKVWAEYVTTIITTSFIPWEIYEMVQHKSWLKGVVIAANLAIVIYLVWRLRRDKHWPFR